MESTEVRKAVDREQAEIPEQVWLTGESSMNAGQEKTGEEEPAQSDPLGGRELSAIIEAVLFVSGEALSVARLASVIGTVSKAEVDVALKALQEQLAHDSRGIQLVKVAGGYRLVTKPDYAPWLKRLDKAKAAQKLSRSALESLAIIAYKQPLVRAEIEEIRGVETSGVLRTLLERKLVRIVGRKEVPGRPIMYGTTKFFLEHFGLEDLGQLPPLREFKELGEAEQAHLPIEDTSPIGETNSDEADGTDDPPSGTEDEKGILVGRGVQEEVQLDEPMFGRIG